MKISPRSTAAIMAALAGTALLAGCGTSADGGAYDSSSTASEEIQMTSDEAGWAEDAEMDSADGSFSGGIYEPQIIVYGNATVYVKDPEAAARGFEDYVAEVGGRVESTWVSNEDPNRIANVYVSVPAEKYEDALVHLETLGRVLDESTSREDVGQQVADLDGRRESLESSIARLEDLMSQATTTEELLLAEDSLTQRKGELDSLNAQLEWLEDQVAMSNLGVTFTDSTASAPGFTWAKAWGYVVQSFNFVAYALVIAVPWVVVVGGIAWGITALARRNRLPRPKKVQNEDDFENGA